MKDLYLMVAHHKNDFFLEYSKKYFNPIQVGKSISTADLNVEADNRGENISYKNKNYCELTAYYYAWKNINAEYIGLMHYRRIFLKSKMFAKNSIIEINSKNNLENEIQKFTLFLKKNLRKYDVFLPKKISLNNLTIKEQYALCHDVKDYENIEQIVISRYPYMKKSVEKVARMKKMHAFNMFIMNAELFDKYCTWLFDILSEFENKYFIPKTDDYQNRLFGFLSERLLNIFIEFYRKELRICELNVGFLNLKEEE